MVVMLSVAKEDKTFINIHDLSCEEVEKLAKLFEKPINTIKTESGKKLNITTFEIGRQEITVYCEMKE